MNRAASLSKIGKYIETAAAQNADIIVFGEGAVPGYPFWVSETSGAKFNDPMQKEIL